MQQKNRRIATIDALRGFALLGILWVNIYVFNAPYAHYSEFYGAFKGVNGLLVAFSSTFIAGKFMFIFAFLFGYGAAMQYRKMNNDLLFASFWNRRMLGLAIFGVLHLVLFWFGDILLPYAILGVLIPLLVRQKVRTLLIGGIACYYSSVLFVFAEKWFEANVISIQSELSLKEFIMIYSKSSFTDLLPYRISEFWSLTNEKLAFYMPKELALFCLGIAAGKLKAIEQFKPKPPWLVVGLAFAIIWFTTRQVYFSWYNPEENPLIIPFLIAQNILFEILLGSVYVFGFLSVFRDKIGEYLLKLFIPVGRMSLTNYFLQSLVCVLLFYGYGYGLYGSLSPLELLLYTIIIYVMQVLISWLWLQRFDQGPLEGIWRNWSYRRRFF